MNKEKARQRLKGIAIIALIVIIFGLMAAGAYSITVSLLSQPAI